MKIKFIPTGNSPDYYNFSGEEIMAYKDDEQESFDLSDLEKGDKFEGVGKQTENEDGEINREPVLDMPGSQVIRDAHRDSDGELHITLCQAVGPGHWGESEEFDSNDYDPDTIYVEYNKYKKHAGTPWALTRQGKTEVNNG